MPPEIPSFGVRKPPRAVSERAAAEFESRQERRTETKPPELEEPRPTEELQTRGVASSQRHAVAPVQVPTPGEPTAESLPVRRSRGSWTRAKPYVRADGVATRSTTIYLPVGLAEALRRYAFESDRRQSDVVEEALTALLGARVPYFAPRTTASPSTNPYRR